MFSTQTIGLDVLHQFDMGHIFELTFSLNDSNENGFDMLLFNKTILSSYFEYICSNKARP